MRKRLKQQLADFLRAQRGEMTYAQFSRKVGLSPSSIQRLEIGQQNITIDGLQTILDRLKCRITDVFGGN